MKHLAWLCLVGLLAGCTLQGPLPGTGTGTATQSASHPRFAPPPGGHSHWDSALGVYVLENADHLYYRERTYYRWSGGWSWSSRPQGPWQPTDGSGVPAGLNRHYQR